MATRATKPFKRKKQGQHWLKNPASRTLSIHDVFRMGEEGCRDFFLRARWPDGNPVCPDCGSRRTYNIKSQNRFKCANSECYKFFSITSGTMFAHKRISYLELMLIVRAMAVRPGRDLLMQAASAMRLSARSYTRMLRVARTIADLAGAEQVGRIHVAEALSYRRQAPRA